MELQANRQAVERWARTIASTDLSDLDEVLHPDAEEIYPQSGERFVGRFDAPDWRAPFRAEARR